MGWSFDWSREIDTTDENYYKWTQWIFKKLFDNDCAYKSTTEVNFCPNCQTVLSNEDSQGGICDRCKSTVEKRIRDVWFLKMRDYSDKMLENIEHIEMAENHKESQRQWIGKSEGAEMDFPIKDSDKKLRIFTTRPDTLFGVTFMVVAPEHPIMGVGGEY
jgi:leucyl-tRNA synthetase